MLTETGKEGMRHAFLHSLAAHISHKIIVCAFLQIYFVQRIIKMFMRRAVRQLDEIVDCNQQRQQLSTAVCHGRHKAHRTAKINMQTSVLSSHLARDKQQKVDIISPAGDSLGFTFFVIIYYSWSHSTLCTLECHW